MNESDKPKSDSLRETNINLEVRTFRGGQTEINLDSRQGDTFDVEQAESPGFGKKLWDGFVWCLQNPDVFLKWTLTIIVCQLILNQGLNIRALAPWLGITLPVPNASPTPATQPTP
ncbi:MAG: hypothetical protein AAFX40_11300 [Cyanobacteria bacterium J06639_1]